MKLLFCKNCLSLFSISSKDKFCDCKSSGGRYIDEINAIYCGNCTPIGFANTTFLDAIKNQPNEEVW